MDIDYTSRPAGSYFGGKHAVTVECRKCGLPGVLIKTSKTVRANVTGTHYSYVHGATLKLKNNEATLVYGPECAAWVAD